MHCRVYIPAFYIPAPADLRETAGLNPPQWLYSNMQSSCLGRLARRHCSCRDAAHMKPVGLQVCLSMDSEL